MLVVQHKGKKNPQQHIAREIIKYLTHLACDNSSRFAFFPAFRRAFEGAALKEIAFCSNFPRKTSLQFSLQLASITPTNRFTFVFTHKFLMHTNKHTYIRIHSQQINKHIHTHTYLHINTLYIPSQKSTNIIIIDSIPKSSFTGYLIMVKTIKNVQSFF